jgi:hypothetical protein
MLRRSDQSPKLRRRIGNRELGFAKMGLRVASPAEFRMAFQVGRRSTSARLRSARGFSSFPGVTAVNS